MSKAHERREVVQLFFNKAPCEPWSPTQVMKLNRLDPKQRRQCKPFALRAVIQLNEKNLEVVEPHYFARGLGAPLLIPLGVFGVGIFGSMIWLGSRQQDSLSQPLLAVAFFGTTVLAFAFSSLMLLSGLKRNLGHTHKPVRFNRNTRTVHIFRHNRRGGVTSLPWDEIHFCRQIGLMGYIPDEQGRVTNAFWFGGTAAGVGPLYDQWEYIRRYMEDGPQAVPEPDTLLPLNDRREPFWYGMLLMFFVGGPSVAFAIGMAPLTILSGLFRYVGMRLSFRPKWPQYIEDECRPDPDDAYASKPRPPLNIPYRLIIPVTIITLAIDPWLFWWLFLGSGLSS